MASKTSSATSSKKSQAAAPTLPEIDIERMFELGCHLGHPVAKWHPKMAPFIYGAESGIHLFDLVKTAEQLQKASQLFFDIAKDNKQLLLVGTKRSTRDIIKQAAEQIGCFYINSRWMGGLLTNFEQLRKSIERMGQIETGLKTGQFDKYTKYERVQLEKEQTKLERFFIGLQGLKGKPDYIFVVDPQKEKIAVREANLTDVPVIALADSNADPRPLSLVIPANDDSAKSIQYVVDQLVAAYQAGLAARS